MPKTLLVADDSITIQKVVGITFAREDYSISAVDNGEDAIARARELKPDLVLADVVMPRKNGYEVCEAMKGDPSLRHIPVLLLAGSFEAFDENRARAAGADGHISKPFETQALINKVKELLGEAGATSQSAGPARVTSTPTPPARPVATPPPMRKESPPAVQETRAAPAVPDTSTPDARTPPPQPVPDTAAKPVPDNLIPGQLPSAAARPAAVAAVPGIGSAGMRAPQQERGVETPGAPAPSVAPATRPASDGGEAALREALSKASREVIERIVWEVVPPLAEAILREQIERLVKEREQ